MSNKNHGNTQETSQDAIALLTEDHRKVSALFKQFYNSDDEGERAELLDAICQELAIHAEIEEDILYPAAREALGQAAMIAEAEVEHQVAKDLIAQLDGMMSNDTRCMATLRVLNEYVAHHIREEEDEIFPALRKSSLDLAKLGVELGQRKDALRAEYEESSTPEAHGGISRE